MCCSTLGFYSDVGIAVVGTIVSKGLEDLAKLIFEELDPSLSNYLMIGVMGKADDRIHKVYVVGIAYSMQGLLENCSL
jgi:hypothetical protein